MKRSCGTSELRAGIWRLGQADARASNVRLKCVANPDGHLRFGGKRQHVWMKHFCATGGERVRFIIAQVMEKFRFDRCVWVRGVNAVYVGPDDEFFGVDDVGDDSAGEIGAVTAERGDAAVGGGTDEAGDDRV